MNKLTKLGAIFCMAVMAVPSLMARENPFLKAYDTKYGIPPFELIETGDFLPAIEAGIQEQNANITRMTANRATPDFNNTIIPLENLSPILDRVAAVFWHYDAAMSTPEFAAMAEKAIPLLNDASNQVNLNPFVFQRIESIYQMRDKMGLDPVQKRLVEKYYRKFAEQGAALPEDKKQELIKVNDELSKLFIQFNKNLLNATNEFYVLVENESELSGLPASSIAMAAEEAVKRGHPGKWAFTLHAPSRLPVLQNADNRELRRKIYEGYTSLASSGQYDNAPVIKQIVKLRAEKAKIMGFDNFAQMMTSRVMAGTPEAAEGLLQDIFKEAV